MVKEEYIEGSLKVQIAFALLIAIFAVLFVFVLSTIREALVTIEVLNTDDPFLAAKMAGRLLLWLVLSSGVIAVAIGIYLLLLVKQIRVQDCYPPTGYPVAVKTKLRFGADCDSVKSSFTFIGWLLLLHPVAGLFVWYWVTGGYW